MNEELKEALRALGRLNYYAESACTTKKEEDDVFGYYYTVHDFIKAQEGVNDDLHK